MSIAPESVFTSIGTPANPASPVTDDHALLIQIAKDAADTRADIAALLEKVSAVVEDVKPTIEQIMRSPMLKMLGVK